MRAKGRGCTGKARKSCNYNSLLFATHNTSFETIWQNVMFYNPKILIKILWFANAIRYPFPKQPIQSTEAAAAVEAAKAERKHKLEWKISSKWEIEIFLKDISII